MIANENENIIIFLKLQIEKRIKVLSYTDI